MSMALAQVVGAARRDARSLRVEIEVPAELARYIAPKGSVALDGVSLTVNSVAGRRFRREPHSRIRWQ